MTPTFLPAGDQALVLQLGETIDPDTNARLIALAALVEAEAWPGVREIVPTYRSLLIAYDPEQLRGSELEARLRRLWDLPGHARAEGRLWHVPCLYGGEVGQDLEELAEMKGMTPEALIAMHAGALYRVYMIGFAPGFAYLGGLPEPLHTPRLPVPRQNIPAGAVGIGGQQASINSVAGPSGWRFIGWTPWQSFDPGRPEPFLFRAGDRIRFRPVEAAEAREIAAEVAAGALMPEPVEGAADAP
jgi:KipI family sensor histidine kinase inhibitor